MNLEERSKRDLLTFASFDEIPSFRTIDRSRFASIATIELRSSSNVYIYIYKI